MPRAPRYDWWMVCVAVLVLGVPGCVQRRMTVRSNPPGATVYVDNVEIGATPVSHDFIYYGTREIRLVKAGYETLTVKQPIPYAWYQVPPLDFVSDNMTPWEIRDERGFVYQLVPQQPIAPEEVRARGEQLRRGSQTVQPLPPVAPPAIMLPEGATTQPGWLPPTGQSQRLWPTP